MNISITFLTDRFIILATVILSIIVIDIIAMTFDYTRADDNPIKKISNQKKVTRSGLYHFCKHLLKDLSLH